MIMLCLSPSGVIVVTEGDYAYPTERLDVVANFCTRLFIQIGFFCVCFLGI